MHDAVAAPLTLHQVATGYRLGRKTKCLARGLDASLRRGRLTCLIGTNGVGKSTLLRTMAGFQPPLEGEVRLGGKPLASLRQSDVARRLSVVLTGQLPTMSLRADELVGMGRMPYTGFWGSLSAADRRVVDEAIEWVGMTPLRDRRLFTLSDGELHKLLIAKALAQQTDVVLLDEPVAFLDFPSKVEILLLLKRLAAEEQKAILLSSHDMELAFQLADHMWLLTPDGRLEEGAPHELADRGSLDFFAESRPLTFNRDTLHFTFNNN